MTEVLDLSPIISTHTRIDDEGENITKLDMSVKQRNTKVKEETKHWLKRNQ